MRRLIQHARPSIFVSSLAAAARLQRHSQCQDKTTIAKGGEIPDRLSAFGLGDIPSSAYKGHFSDAHNAAAAQSAANVAKRRSPGQAEETAKEYAMRKRIACHLMRKLGYTEEELQLLGDDVLRMQGVRSPFPFADLRAGETVVDLGSGFGPDAFLAASKVGEDGQVTGINLSGAEVKQAALRAEERGLSIKRCRFAEADMEATALNSDSVDVVISNGGFCLCPNKRAAFQEVYRVLRPGGRMAICCTILRKPLPALEGKRWPPCMEVFMKRWDIEVVLKGLGFDSIYVEESDSKMDVWDLDTSDLNTVASSPSASIADPSMMCSHAKKAAERRAREEVETFLTKDRESGIHWGNPQFEYIKEFDMNELCARVCIYAEKR